jgi:hypothetical protein
MNEEPQATSSSDDPLTDLYRKYCPSMVRVDLKTADGDFASAAAFHIGDGWLVTARHVIDGGELADLTAHKYAQVSKLRQVIYPKEEREDVALLETGFLVEALHDENPYPSSGPTPGRLTISLSVGTSMTGSATNWS